MKQCQKKLQKQLLIQSIPYLDITIPRDVVLLMISGDGDCMDLWISIMFMMRHWEGWSGDSLWVGGIWTGGITSVFRAGGEKDIEDKMEIENKEKLVKTSESSYSIVHSTAPNLLVIKLYVRVLPPLLCYCSSLIVLVSECVPQL